MKSSFQKNDVIQKNNTKIVGVVEDIVKISGVTHVKALTDSGETKHFKEDELRLVHRPEENCNVIRLAER